MTSPQVQILALVGIPEVRPGDELARLILDAYRRRGLEAEDGDVIVVTQKIVSKAEGRIVSLADVSPSSFASSFASAAGKDERLVEVALQQASRVVKMDRGILITETTQGFVFANSGVDASNVAAADSVTLLPEDPDRSAARLRASLESATGKALATIISDTFGRPWREGVVNVAIGASGVPPLVDYRGQTDTEGRLLSTTVVAIADELAAAAELVMGKLERVPVALVRGYAFSTGPAGPHHERGAKALRRSAEHDLFR